ncbi:hypothetical protein [Alteriqipengyuania sp. 357]
MRGIATCLFAGTVPLAGCDTDRPAPAPEASATTARSEQPVVIAPAPETVPAASAEMTVPEPDATPTSQPTLFNLPDVPASDVAEDRAALTAIPARFLGQWDAPAGPCSPESDMFLTIRPGTITFYESLGEVSAVRRGNPGIVVRLEMEGEGERWTNEYAMRLVSNSEQLAMRATAGSASATTRRRCPPLAAASEASGA